jgi:hypothetical protein
MEKLEWRASVEALAGVGRFAAPGEGLLLVLAATLLWLAGFLGLRLLGLPILFRDLSSRSFLLSLLAWFAVIGFPLSLLLRIAPAEAQGLSRLEAVNDAGWFVTASGIVLWFPTARALSRLRPEVAALAVLLLALPSTAQHFFHAASLGRDRIGKDRVDAAREAQRLSAPESLWVAPLDRARPSLLPYFSGRAVVYDRYVGYDYMFVSREELDYRRHALAQFWSSSDPAYLGWFLKRFRVDFVWREERARPSSPDEVLDSVFENGEVELLKVKKDAVERALDLPIETPETLPLGGRGQAYFGSGWLRGEGSSVTRVLPPGDARLYLPLEREREMVLDFTVALPGDGGELLVDGRGPVLVEPSKARFALPPRRARGLQAIDVEWKGRAPLLVSAIEIAVVP